MAHVNATLGESLKGVNKVMDQCNADMSVSDIIKMVTDFEKAGMKMEAKGDAMSDAMGALGDGGIDEEADSIYNQVCEE